MTDRLPTIAGVLVGVAVVVVMFTVGPSWILGLVFVVLLVGWLVFAIRDRKFP
jgi:hypothetical protein